MLGEFSSMCLSDTVPDYCEPVMTALIAYNIQPNHSIISALILRQKVM